MQITRKIMDIIHELLYIQGPSWSWSYGSWIYNYQYNQCLSPITLRVKSRSWRGAFDTTLRDKVCQWLAAGHWFSPGILVSSINKTDCRHITEILSKVKWNTINQTLTSYPGAWYIQTLYFHFSRVNTTDNLLSTMTFVICHLPNNVVPNERWWQWHMYDGYWFILGFFLHFTCCLNQNWKIICNLITTLGICLYKKKRTKIMNVAHLFSFLYCPIMCL